MNPIDRIAVFTGPTFSHSTIETIESLIESRPRVRFVVISGGLRVSTRTRLENKWKRFKSFPFSTVLETAESAFQRIHGSRTSAAFAGPLQPLDLHRLAGERVQVRRFDRIHSPEAVAAVRAFAPQLGVSVGAPVLRKSLFTVPELGTLNLHKSLLPEYRGLPPGFWELRDGAETAGVTVHWVDKGLDTGRIVLQRSVPIPPWTTWPGLRLVLDDIGAELLVQAIGAVEQGNGQGVQQTSVHAMPHRQPPAFLRWKLNRELERRRRKDASILRNAAKRVLQTAYVSIYAPIRNLADSLRGRSPAMVLLYHRVSDSFFDTVTVGVEQFDRQMAILAKRYEVVDLRTFLAGQGRPRRRRQVVVTFDDGYDDNFLAAKILRRQGLPATFFICSRIVGTDRAFPHDELRLKRCVPALSWSKAKKMAQWGFEFGNHTTLHVNLGSVDQTTAEEAVRGAAADLRMQLGSTGPGELLAYPYGGPRDITEELRARLPELGVKNCLSAYGGTNPPDFDPWNILRQGVDAKMDDLAFRAVVEGWTIRG
jgi:peptidoglycan/xylan/chitin deacetylase (PgdA/CDA1 family)